MAIGGEHEVGHYLTTPAWLHFRNRGKWIVVLAALGLVSGMIMYSFHETLRAMPILADVETSCPSRLKWTDSSF